MVKKIVRPYELSLWTLQDEFLCVLKPINLSFTLGTPKQTPTTKAAPTIPDIRGTNTVLPKLFLLFTGTCLKLLSEL